VTVPPRVLVTGAGGFVGSHVVSELLAAGARVKALVRNEASAEELLIRLDPRYSVQIAIGSLGDDAIEPDLVAGSDVVVHAAGTLRGAASTLVRQNVIATRRLVRAALRGGVRRFVLVSSMSVYGTAALRRGDLLDEDCAIDPKSEKRTPYVYSKIAQERICWDACRDELLPLVVIRPGVIYGPGHTGLSDRIGPRIGGWIAMVGPRRSLPYTFVGNCARAVAVAATTPAPVVGQAFNIVDDELPTPRDIVNGCRSTGALTHVLSMPAACAPFLGRMYDRVYAWSDGMLPPVFVSSVVEAMYKPLRFSNERATRVLGWRPTVNLHDALRCTFGTPP